MPSQRALSDLPRLCERTVRLFKRDRSECCINCVRVRLACCASGFVSALTAFKRLTGVARTTAVTTAVSIHCMQYGLEHQSHDIPVRDARLQVGTTRRHSTVDTGERATPRQFARTPTQGPSVKRQALSEGRSGHLNSEGLPGARPASQCPSLS